MNRMDIGLAGDLRSANLITTYAVHGGRPIGKSASDDSGRRARVPGWGAPPPASLGG